VNRRWITIAAAIPVLAAAIFFAIRGRKPQPAPPPSPPPPVATEANLSGRIEPRTLVPVGAPIEGAIDAYYLDVGQEVYQDQLLGRIRNSDLDTAAEQAQLALDRAQTRLTTLNAQQLESKLEVSRSEADLSRTRNDLERLEKEYQRQKGLWDVGATPRLVYEKAEKEYKNAQNDAEKLELSAKEADARAKQLASDLDGANTAVIGATKALESAKTNLNRGEIHSPADGIVAARKGSPGDAVDANSKDLFEIATNLTELQITLTADDPARIHAGQKAQIHAPDLTPAEISGTVREVQRNQVIVDFTSPVAITKLDLVAQVKIKF